MVSMGRLPWNNSFLILFFWTLIVFEGNVRICSGQNCGNNDFFGDRDPNRKDDRIGSNTGYGFLVGEPSYIVDCCGVVDGWEADLEVSGSQTIYYQLWRLQSGDTWELIGENAYTTSSDGEQSTTIAANQRISIQPNDRFGWWTAGSEMVRYKDGGMEKDDTIAMAMADPAVGDTRDWTATPIDRRTNAIRMDVAASSNPSFTNIAASKTISNTDAAGITIFTVSVTDVNPDDVSSLTVSMASNSKFTFDTSSKAVTITSSLLGQGSNTETLSFTVTDQCSKTGSGTLTVSIVNTPPVIDNLPDSTSFSETITAETLHHTITVTDVGDTITCTITSPASAPFTLKPSDKGIYSNTNPGFDYDAASSYVLQISCTDGYSADTGTYTVTLIRNSAPVFTNLQGSTSVATSTTTGTPIFTASATDAEGDQLLYNMTCTPSPCPFSILASGILQTTETLTTHTTVGYDISVYVYDGRTLVGPGILSITITGINDPVMINNLPLSAGLTVAENSVLGKSLYHVGITDADSTDTHTYTMTSSPAVGLTYFSIGTSTGLISTSSTTNINFEPLTTTSYTLTVTVTDGTASDSQSVTMEVVDVPESPSFDKSLYSVSTSEGLAGAALPDPIFGVTDPDDGDTTYFTLHCGSSTGYFHMATSDGTLTFASDYDLDVGSRPTSVTCTVTVTDSAGLTDTCTLTITIADLNDNTPSFAPTSYSFFVSFYASTGTTVGIVTATDADSGAYGVISFTIDQASLGAEYFGITNSGAIYTLLAMTPIGVGESVTITVTATDTGGLNAVATVVIVVSDSTTTSSTTVSPDRYKTFTEDSRNVIWIIACALVLLIIIVFCVWFFCIGRGGKEMMDVLRKSCRSKEKSKKSKRNLRRRRRPSTPETPVTPIRFRDLQLDAIRIEPPQSIRQPPPPPGNHSWITRPR